MSVRVIAGRAKGRRLETPDLPQMRPTTDRTKQILFDILADAPAGAKVLDLYAGSGSLGIEAWSRGAEGLVFVERDPVAARAIRRNLRAVGAEGTVVVDSVEDFLERPGHTPADLAFLDPPYGPGLGSLPGVLRGLMTSGAIRRGAIVVVESPEPIRWPDGLTEYRQRKVGGTTLSFTRHDGDHSDLSRDL